MKSILILFLFAYTMFAQAQEKGDSLGIGIELTSKYMWRGIEYGTAPTVFPSLNYHKGGFNASVLGVYSLNGAHSEVDMSLGYTYKNLFVGVSDYYYPSEVGSKDTYFKYRNRDTKHCVELYGTYNFSRIPIWITYSTYIFGADKGPDGVNAYSNYGEIGYQHQLSSDNVLSLCCGATFNRSFYTEYTKRFSVVNVCLKYMSSIKFGKFALPVSTSFIYNPYKNKSFVTFSLYLHS